MKKLLILVFALGSAAVAQTTLIYGNRDIRGFFDAASGTFRLPQSTVAALPAAIGVPGRIYVVTDGPSCTSGGGSTAALCRSNGTAWVTLGGSGGGGVWGSITGTLSDQLDLAAALGGKEPTIAAGTTAQYWRGDKSWQTLSTAVLAAMSGLYEVPLTFNSGLTRSTNTITCSTASGSVFGCLLAADWTTFNGKQSAISGAPGTWPSTFAPSAHASTHASAGSDPVTLAESQITGLVADLAAKAGLGANTFTGNQAIGTTVLDPTNGIKGPIIACVGAPGNTTGPYGSLCEVRATGALWGCANATGCTVSADWAAAGGSGSLVMTTGAGAPSANCTAPSSSNLAMYYDTTNYRLSFCSSVTNKWMAIPGVWNVGAATISGVTGTVATGTAASRPSCTVEALYLASDTHVLSQCSSITLAWSTLNPAGSVVLVWDTTAGTVQSYDSGGTVKTLVQPITCSAGQHVSAITAAGVVTCSADTSGGDVTAIDPTTAWGRDEFLPSGGGNNYNLGELQWQNGTVSACSAAPTFVVDATTDNHPGVMHSVTNATLNTGCTINLTGNAVYPFRNLAAAVFTTYWIVRPGNTTNVTYRVGWTQDVTASVPSGGIWVRYDTTAGDTTFNYETRSGSVSSGPIDSTIAPNTANWYKIRIRAQTAGVIGFAISTNGGAFSTEKTFCVASSGCDVNSATIPTTTIVPGFQTIAREAVAKSLDIDFFAYIVTGLGR